MNRAHLENDTYEQIVTHLDRELDLTGLEAPNELQINTVSYNTAETKADKPKPMCHHCKKIWKLQKSVPFTKKAKRTG